MLEAGCDACATGAFAALVTGPVQKSAIQDAGIPFSGHTEFFAERTHTPRVVMMLVERRRERPLRVALVTTHLPLRDVPDAITRAAVAETLAIVRRELIERFGIAEPRIAVCGLNPHAGEGGHLGREDIDVIAPAIEAARARGANVTGPLPADTVFVPDIAQRFDAIVAMYHDQGLPVLKAASFGHGVNVTLGLPFIRTSVDHGTALDLAVDAARAKTPMSAASSRPSISRSSSLRARGDVDRARHAGPSAAQALRAELPRRCALRRAHRRGDRSAPGDNIVEIGPGLGALTGALVDARRTDQRDRDRSRPRRAACATGFAPERLALHEADALAFDFCDAGRRPARRRQPAVQHQLAAAVSPCFRSMRSCATST